MTNEKNLSPAVPLAGKTVFLADTLRAMAGLDDQFCYLTFVAEEFDATLARLPSSKVDRFTTEVFSSNSRAARIHVPVAELPEFARRTAELAFAAFFSASYEAAADYLTKVRTMVEAEYPPGTLPNSRDPPEDLLKAAMDHAGHALDANLVSTLAYCRLRRNLIVHGVDGTTSTLRSIVRNKGHALGKFWAAVSDLDFSELPSRYPSEIETVALFVVLREVVRKVDQVVAPVQDVAEAARRTRVELYEAQPELRSTSQSARVRRKVRALLRMRLGVTLTDEQVGEVLDPDMS